jgi:hypothetical protein
MGYDTNRARYEAAIARAHRAAWSAQGAAELLGDTQAHDELWEILLRLERLQEASLRGKLKPDLVAQRRRAQTHLT